MNDTRRSFVGQLTALLGGWGLLPWVGVRQAEAEQVTEWGVWRDGDDPGALATVLIAEGYLLGFCRSLNKEMRAVELDVAVWDWGDGKGPRPAMCDNRAVSQRMVLGDALEIYTDGKNHPNKGFRHWTGSGWANSQGEPISGPTPRILRDIVAGEALSAEKRIRIRNGRAYHA